MNKFSDETNDYEKFPVYKAVENFFNGLVLERDYEKILSFMDADFEGIGTVDEVIVKNKIEFIDVLKKELEATTNQITYTITSISGKEIAENIWNIMAVLEFNVMTGFEQKSRHHMHITGCFGVCGEKYSVKTLHLSKSVSAMGKTNTDNMIYDIISKSMPGGIVIGYAREGYPLCFANERYLQLLGYDSYEEYYQDAGGMGLCHIHPDDLDMVNQQIKESYSTNEQFGIEYRIRHKEGYYLSVYDIGKKTVLPNNKEIIICVLYDMTEEVRMKEILIHDSSYDALTGIYNRGGGLRAISDALEETDKYSFMFFDVDNLKLLNDKYSHKAGDHALQYFSELLMKYFVEQTILVRLGGDEFVAFLNNKMTFQRLQRIFTILEQEYCGFIDEYYPESNSSVSIGCVLGEKKYSFEELYRITDELMYDIKKHGKRGYKIIELGEVD